MKEQLGMSRQEVKDDVYYKLLLEKVATKDIQVSDSEIQDYIQAHPEEYAKKGKCIFAGLQQKPGSRRTR
ncbi:hypothetical protein P7H25_17615 [Paenibacillus larvae]|nr:hypothetical protein [Paenibacillus larvae]MDT2235530.1 hypothetical protein [Paenibacillus larvae]MDT2257031.1 hypothetical protein [Paenibacillus larvae]MDT2292805.1 hypothetical protein [Paenibacillus larvae]